MNKRWSEERINKWYSELPWLRGCNFLPSNAINRLDMWQSYNKKEHLEVADKELKMCEELGFNTVRLWLNFDVYHKEKDEFMDTLESYISLSAKYHQLVVLVLAYEEDLPYQDKFVAKELGPQKELYTHFNRDYKEYNKHLINHEFKHYIEYPKIKEEFIEMIKRVMEKYKDDSRIVLLNVENEPGNTLNEKAIPLLNELFSLVRSYDPIQPLCADIWRGINEDGSFNSKEETLAYELSDVISFHCYSPFESFKHKIELLKKYYNRPIFISEWLNRCNHSNVIDIYPYMYENKIANHCWGFVAGKTYTTEPWEDFWDLEEKDNNIDFDFTKWQHELYRLNGRPYDPKEIRIIKEYNSK